MRYIFFLSLLFATATGMAQTKTNDSFHWLEGNWVMSAGPKGNITESWQRVNDSLYSGRSVFVTAKGDTIPQESIRLLRRSGQWLYIPVAKGQNDEQPVPFTITASDEKGFTAENPQHDFPQKISYVLTSSTTITATISGNRNGKEVKRDFNFVKQ
jgi:Domain of unknown function (DUF6265)